MLVTVVFSMRSVPVLAMPPPRSARLSWTMLVVSVSSPALNTPPPAPHASPPAIITPRTVAVAVAEIARARPPNAPCQSATIRD